MKESGQLRVMIRREEVNVEHVVIPLSQQPHMLSSILRHKR